jgi:4-hydroxy-tetrahydrodipicolinate reductase
VLGAPAGPRVTVRLVVNGAAGRMGRQVIAAATGAPDVQVAGAIVRPGSPLADQDAGLVAGVERLGVPLVVDPETALTGATVAVDVSVPAATVPFANAAANREVPIIVATTGLSLAQRERIEALATRTAVLIAPNLSLGINLIAELLPTIVCALGPDYDVEVVEAHHRHKNDAPSGTAVRLAEVIASALERPLAELARHGRHGIAPRAPGEIGMHALRLGGLAGEHSVYFASEGEVIEIYHRALSRETFARGAVRAARFLSGKQPGIYTMQNVLGIGG